MEMRKLRGTEVEGNPDPRRATGVEWTGRGPFESLRGGRGSASLACSYRLAGAEKLLQSASPGSLCNYVALTLPAP